MCLPKTSQLMIGTKFTQQYYKGKVCVSYNTSYYLASAGQCSLAGLAAVVAEMKLMRSFTPVIIWVLSCALVLVKCAGIVVVFDEV